MREFFETVCTIMIVLAIVASVIGLGIGIAKIMYWLDSILDTSEGTVYCDFENVYTGRLYRVDHVLETENLQAPVFSVYVHSENSPFRVEKTLFCKDLQISGK